MIARFYNDDVVDDRRLVAHSAQKMYSLVADVDPTA